MANPFDRAYAGDVEFFRNVALDVMQKSIDEDVGSVLHVAVMGNHLDCCKEIFKRCPSLLYHKNTNNNTVLHLAAMEGMAEILEFLISANAQLNSENGDIESGGGGEIKNLLTMRNRQGETGLHHAVRYEKPVSVKMLLEADPDRRLLRMVNKKRETALHLAVENHNFEIVILLIEAKLNSENGDIESGGGGEIKNLLTMTDYQGETVLHYAVRHAKPVSVKMLLEADPDRQLLKMVNISGESAFDIAEKSHYFEIVILLIEAEPDFDYGAAVLHEDTGSAGKIRKVLFEKQPSKLKIRTCDNGWTLLHRATYKGHLGAIEDIIRFCPDCMEVVDNEGRNFLHLAAKYENVKVVKQILGIKEIDASILNRQDKEGNTPLHTAALSGNQIISECFLYDHRVTKTTVNNNGQDVLDAINFDYDKAKAGVFGFRGRMNQKELKDQSDFDLVVGALIAAVSFTTGITVPGGYISEGPNQGMAVLSKVRSFQAFVVSNNFALMFSLYAVFSHFCTRSMHTKEDISYQLKVATFCTLGAIFAMMVAFITGSYTVLANSDGLSITVCVQCCCFFIFALRAIWKMVPQRFRK